VMYEIGSTSHSRPVHTPSKSLALIPAPVEESEGGERQSLNEGRQHSVLVSKDVICDITRSLLKGHYSFSPKSITFI